MPVGTVTFSTARGNVLRARYNVVTYLHKWAPNQAERVPRMRVVSSREFNQDVSQAKRLARFEPVFVTDRGCPTHVLMSMEAFRRLSGQSETIVDLLALPNAPAPGAPESDLSDRADPWRHRDAER